VSVRAAAFTAVTGSASVASYAALTKPGITVFVTLTAAAGWIAAAEVETGRFVLMLLATALMSGGAAACNHLVERESDACMRRTATRPIPSGRVSVHGAAMFAMGLSATGLTVALLALPLAATLLLAVCHVSYVLVYTPLKRVTPLCTLVGAVPGALPVLVGWTAAGAPVSAAVIAIAGMLFVWQIPHFLAIGWLCREEYAAAGLRVLSAADVTGRLTARLSLMATLALLPMTFVPYLAGGTGGFFVLAGVCLGACYAAAAARLLLRRTPRHARLLFFASLAYLPLLLAALVLDHGMR
jgi:heme o synthase